MFVKKLKQQFAVVSALVIREMATRYGTKIGGYAWAIIDPLSHIGFLSLIFIAIARAPALGDNFPLFFASGYIPFWIYKSLSDQVANSVSSNRALLNYPLVHPYDTIFARVILQLVTIFVVYIIIFSGIGNFVAPLPKLDYEIILAAGLVAVILGVGVGMVNVALFHLSSTYQQIYGIISRPLFLISGVFMLPDYVPHPFQEYMMWLPIAHIVCWFRKGFYGTYRGQLIDYEWTVLIALAIFWAGFIAIKLFDAQLRENPQ